MAFGSAAASVKRVSLRAAVLGLCCLASGVLRAASLPDAVDASSECTLCHGTDGKGNAAIGAPNIAVLAPWYLRRQLEAYREGYRGKDARDQRGAEMRSIAAAIDDKAALEAVVRYAASFASAPSPATLSGDVEHGRTLYAACVQCHGQRAEGNSKLGAPRLSGQSDWYLARQLSAYMDGWRGAQRSDHWGAQMRPFAAELSGQTAIDDVVAYIASLTPASAADGAAEPSGRRGGIVRYPLPNNSTFPIASMVAVPPGAVVIQHSGMTPRPANPQADPDSRAYYGDTEAQASSVFERMQASLHTAGFGLGDIVKLTVFLAGDPQKGGAMDFSGFMRAYTRYFGTKEQPKLPARSVVQVARLANPHIMVEIEAVAAKAED